MPTYTGAVARTANEKFGERISVLDFGALGDGVQDDAPAFADAWAAANAKGGCEIYVPGSIGLAGYRFASELDIATTAPITLVGDGRASKIYRDFTVTSGKGMIDLQAAKNVTFRNLLIDGAVTSSTGVLYSSFSGDPMHSSLTANTSIWAHGGEELLFDGVWIEHTGGYAILLDARSANVSRARVTRSVLRNNRPHLFGTSGGDLNYGSWTGGILCQNQATGGSAFRVSDLIVDGNRFERNTGNCVWQHGYGFDAFHQRIKVNNNVFLDCGLDGILFGNTIGGSAIGNTFRRIGYVCSDDTSASVPKWLAGLNATALDTSGDVRNVVYANNDFVSINGGCINGDGFGHGSVTGNTMRVPSSGDPEYTEDSIGSSGPDHAGANWCQGIIFGNSQNRDGGLGVTVANNQFYNLGGCCIGLYAGRKSTAIGNTIVAPASPNQTPIMVGGFGASSNMNANGNVVTRNVIHYSPGSAAACIAEDATLRAFTSTDKNLVVGNYVFGTNAFEFAKDANSGSIATESFTTTATVTATSSHSMQREGSSASSSSALKFYFRDGATSYGHMQLQGYRGGGIRDPLLNVSDPTVNSGASGVISTGPHTTLGVSHAMITGKLIGTGFLALGDSTYSSSDANTFTDAYALLRWNDSLNKWQQSVSTSAGARVWTDFSAASSPGGGSDTQVQFNDGGTLSGVADFTWDKTTKLLTVLTASGSPGLAVGSGYIQAAQGFLAPGSTATNYNSIQAPGGGVYALAVTVDDYAVFGAKSSIAALTGGSFTSKSILWRDSASGRLRLTSGSGSSDGGMQAGAFYCTGTAQDSIYVPNGGVQGLSWTSVRNDADAGIVLRRTSTTAREWGMSVTASGEFLLTDRSSGAATLYSLPAASSAASIVYTPGYFQSVVGFLTTGTSYQSVNVGSGGSYARSHRATTYTQIGQSFGAPSATSGDSLVDGCIYYDTNTNTVKARISGSFSDLLTSAGSQSQYVATNTGSSITFKNNNNNFQVDGNGNISAVAVITSTGASGGVNVTGQTATNSIQTVGGFNAGSGGSSNGVYQVFGTTVINSSRQFVGAGAVMTGGCAATGFNINGGGTGQTWNISISGSQFVISGIGSFNNLIFQGGVLVSAS